jgi:hypothetical protein
MDKSEEVGYAARGNVTRDGVYGAYIVEKEERVDEEVLAQERSTTGQFTVKYSNERQHRGQSETGTTSTMH